MNLLCACGYNDDYTHIPSRWIIFLVGILIIFNLCFDSEFDDEVEKIGWNYLIMEKQEKKKY